MVVEVTSEPVLPVLFEPGDWMGVRALGAKGVRALASKIVRAMMRSMGVRSMGSICVRAMGVRVLTGSFFAFFLVRWFNMCTCDGCTCSDRVVFRILSRFFQRPTHVQSPFDIFSQSNSLFVIWHLALYLHLRSSP